MNPPEYKMSNLSSRILDENIFFFFWEKNGQKIENLPQRAPPRTSDTANKRKEFLENDFKEDRKIPAGN